MFSLRYAVPYAAGRFRISGSGGCCTVHPRSGEVRGLLKITVCFQSIGFARTFQQGIDFA